MTKKCFLIALFYLSLYLTIINAQSLWINGDVNHDNQVNILDALLIAQYYIGIIETDTSLGNVNCDHQVNIVDALLIAQFYVGIYPNLPSCPSTEPTSPSPDSRRSPNPTPEERKSFI